MSDFVQTMKDWWRMCQQMDEVFGMNCCDHCPLGACMAVYESDGSEDYAALERKVAKWAAENPEVVYPTWTEYFRMTGVFPSWLGHEILDNTHIPAETAKQLGVKPKKVSE